MRWIRAVIKETWGLFVDDGVFALFIVGWLAAASMLPRLALPPAWSCLILFAGLASILLRSALARARQV